MAPGEAISFPIRLSLDGTRSGFISQTVKLVTDEPDAGPYAITISGIVDAQRIVSIIPQVIDFGRFGEWENPKATARLHFRDGQDLKVANVSGVDSCVSCRPQGAEGDGSLTYEIVTSSALACGPLNRRIDFQTSHGAADLWIKGQKIREPIVDPPILVVRRGQTKKSLLLKHRPGTRCQGLTARSDRLKVECDKIESVNDGMTRVHIRVRDLANDQFMRATLQLEGLLGRTAFATGPINVYVDTRVAGPTSPLE